MNLTPITARVRRGHAKALLVDMAQFDIENPDVIVAAALTQFFRSNRADTRQALYLTEAQAVSDGDKSIGVPRENILGVQTLALMTI